MSDFDRVAKQIQSYYKNIPTILLGSGASAGFGVPGMWALAQHLIASVDVSGISPEEQHSWLQFTDELKKGIDLETSLTNVRLSPTLTERVIQGTWILINQHDLRIFQESLNDLNYFPLGKLFAHMFDSTARSINVITTNYDRIAEYSCEQQGFHHYCGFSHGYRKVEVEHDYLRAKRIVNILKVHGSLEWFRNEEGMNLAVGNLPDIPEGLLPLIITPGIEKYERTNREPFRSVITRADQALVAANLYLCIGYGFNDTHIQEKLVNKCIRDGAPILVITQELTDTAKAFLFDAGVKSYVAIQKKPGEDGSEIFSSEFSSSIEVSGDYWSLGGFLKIVM